MFEVKVILHADETMIEFARTLAGVIQSATATRDVSPEVKPSGMPKPAETTAPAAVKDMPAAAQNTSVTPVPTTARTYTREEVSRAAASLLDAGKGTALVELLHRFGAQAITQLPEDKLGEFATGLRGMGAKI